MAAFVQSLPVLRRSHAIATTKSLLDVKVGLVNRCKRPSIATRLVCVQQKDASTPTSDQSNLKRKLCAQLGGFNRGLDVDPDSETMSPEEADVEETIEDLEDNYPAQLPTKDPNLQGRWRLVYTSSAITRYFGGVTGLQRLLPNATVGEIVQVIDTEDGTSTFEESVTFELPVIGNEISLDILVQGRLRSTNEERQVWEPENVKCGPFSWFADNWKTFRAFQVTDITYLDDELRITRGQTGSVAVFKKVMDGKQKDVLSP